MKKSLIIGLVISAAVVAVGVWAWLKPQAEVVVVEPQRKTMRAYVEEQAVTHLPQDWLVAMPIGFVHRGDSRRTWLIEVYGASLSKDTIIGSPTRSSGR